MKRKQLFEKFVMQNLDNIYRFAFTYTRSKEEAEDIVNESVIKALRSINSLKNVEYIKSWFYRIIINTACTRYKIKNREVSVDFSECGENFLPYCEDDYSEVTLDDLFKSLDEKYRSILILKVCEDMTFHSISEVLNMSENTVKSRFYKALEILKTNLGGDNNA